MKTEPKLRTIKIVVIVATIIFIGLYVYLNNPSISTLKINEVSFEDATLYDWIEIYNPSLQTRSLKEYYITDDKLDLEKFEIKDDILIAPNSFVVIYGKNYPGNDDSAIVANFNIKNGETVYLVEKNTLKIIDSLIVIADEDDAVISSTGRFPDGSDEVFVFTQPSQGMQNVKDHIRGAGVRQRNHE